MASTTDSIDVLIVGAGIGGMSAAVALATSSVKCSITVLEQSEVVAEVGAGLQISPNWTRLLYQWGLRSELEKCAVRPAYTTFVRWQDGRILSRAKLNADDEFEKEYGYPLYHIHRADVLRMLLGRAQQLGVAIRTDSKVIGFEPGANPMQNTVSLTSGEKLSANIVIAADGGRSTLNSFVEEVSSIPTNTGDSAYRALLPANVLEHSDLKDLLDEGSNFSRIWIGPDSHIVSYLVRNKKLLNVAVLVPDSIEPGAEENWKQKGDIEKLRQYFRAWDPKIQTLLGFIEESYLWRLRDRRVPQTWVHQSANLALLGDSAHPMLPYAASGAACCGEDAATLATCLEHVTEDGSFGPRDALKAYESLRVQRATEMVNQSRSNRGLFHLHDGIQQQMRDEKLADPDAMAAVMTNLHGFDAIAEVKKYFEKEQNDFPAKPSSI